MDHSYLNIEGLIRDANQKRSAAMGEMISAAWKSFRKLLASPQYRRPKLAEGATPASLIGIHYLP